jgi:CheY-like chemotaxis protein
MREAGTPLSIVLSDIDLEQEDGSVLIQRIRNHPAIAETPVILLSNAIASDLSIDRAKLDIGDILIKPVKEVDLLESIATALGLRGPDTTIDIELDSASGIVFEQLEILLAEDNRVNQKLAVALLEKIGHQIEVANNGREAVELYRKKAFDLVLMDVQMPEVDGYQATQQIRQIQLQAGKRVPIVALTAHASPADRQRCLASGMDEYLAKPIRAGDLYTLIESLTGHRSALTGEPGDAQHKTHLIDWEMAFETVGGDRKLLEELIRVFLKDQEQMLANIETSISQQDDKNLRLSAHSIKGALNHLGGRSAAKYAEKLEVMAQKENLAKAPAVFEQFRGSLNELAGEMKKFVGD